MSGTERHLWQSQELIVPSAVAVPAPGHRRQQVWACGLVHLVPRAVCVERGQDLVDPLPERVLGWASQHRVHHQLPFVLVRGVRPMPHVVVLQQIVNATHWLDIDVHVDPPVLVDHLIPEHVSQLHPQLDALTASVTPEQILHDLTVDHRLHQLVQRPVPDLPLRIQGCPLLRVVHVLRRHPVRPEPHPVDNTTHR